MIPNMKINILFRANKRLSINMYTKDTINQSTYVKVLQIGIKALTPHGTLYLI